MFIFVIEFREYFLPHKGNSRDEEKMKFTDMQTHLLDLMPIFHDVGEMIFFLKTFLWNKDGINIYLHILGRRVFVEMNIKGLLIMQEDIKMLLHFEFKFFWQGSKFFLLQF